MAHTHSAADYDDAAAVYGTHRSALPWKVVALSKALCGHGRAVVIEVGCGTADYLAALALEFPDFRLFGLDVSVGMLRIASASTAHARVVAACAEEPWPFSSHTSDFIFTIDVMQHLRDFVLFFREAARVLRRRGTLAVLTDSEADIRARSLGKFFPETVPINLTRYPAVDYLKQTAAETGFDVIDELCSGYIRLDDRFVAALQNKALSELRLISAEAHRAGMSRVLAAQAREENWLSRTTILLFKTAASLQP